MSLVLQFDGPAREELQQVAAQFCSYQSIALGLIKAKQRKESRFQLFMQVRLPPPPPLAALTRSWCASSSAGLTRATGGLLGCFPGAQGQACRPLLSTGRAAQTPPHPSTPPLSHAAASETLARAHSQDRPGIAVRRPCSPLSSCMHAGGLFPGL